MIFNRLNLKSFFQWILIAILLASLIGFIYQTDFYLVWDSLLNIGFNFVFILSLTFLAFCAGTISWKYTLPIEHHTIPFRKLLAIRMMGESVALVNPSNVIGGDSFKAYMLNRVGVAYVNSAASLVLARLIMMFTQVLVFLIVGLLFLMLVRMTDQLFTILFSTLGIIAVICSGTFFLLQFFKRRSSKIAYDHRKIQNRWVKNFNNVMLQVSDFYHNHRINFYLAIFWSCMNWVLGSLEIWLIFYFLQIKIGFLDALLVDQGVLVLKSVGAFIPGQIGVEEYANKIMLSFIGIHSAGIWIAVSILRRCRQLFWLLISLILYIFHNSISVQESAFDTEMITTSQ